MTKRLIIGLGSAVFAAVLLLGGCGGAEQTAEKAAPQEEMAKEAMPATTEYPIDFCVVSGEKLGAMGDPVVYDYQGRTVKFCCNMCVKTFEADPAKFIAKLDSAAAAAGGMMEGEGHEGHGEG